MPVDVSKVKLRIKKPGPEGADENSDSRASKLDNSSSVEEDFDMDDGNEDDHVNSSPINLSVKKSSRPNIVQSMQSDTLDKAQKKSNAVSEKEKPPKMKEKLEPEKKVTRQKKNDKVHESPVETPSVKEIQTEILTAAVNTDNKGKRRVRKLPTEKSTVRDQADLVPESQHRPVEERVVKQKAEDENEKSRSRPEKEKEQQKNDSSGKEKKRLEKPRKSGSKKPEKITERIDMPQKPDSSERSQKEKAVKRKVEALDLSTKSTSETPSKAKRLKATAAEKLQSKPSSEDANKTNHVTATLQKSSGTTSAKQKRTRSSSKKASGLQLSANPGKGKTTVDSPSTEALEESGQLGKMNTATNETARAVQEKSLNNTSERMEVSPTCSSGEATPSQAEDCPAPTFLKPTSPPSLMLPSQRAKPTDQEDDEGIHSSHEGGSDISDSASESSDDSGLHSQSSKMANDPETPTDEIPTPTELKSHMCIFCDRTFPLEVEYRRHLNRHLVNIYYMDGTATGQK